MQGIQREIRCSHLLCVRTLRHGKERSHPDNRFAFAEVSASCPRSGLHLPNSRQVCFCSDLDLRKLSQVCSCSGLDLRKSSQVCSCFGFSFREQNKENTGMAKYEVIQTTDEAFYSFIRTRALFYMTYYSKVIFYVNFVFFSCEFSNQYILILK